jgi:DNA-binding HxlR family transcriptional regulator
MKDSFEELRQIGIDNICPIRYAMSFIGQKWKIPLLWHLAEHSPLRYNELKRAVPGITNIMLTQSLRELEEHHLVTRKQYDTVPPMVEYSLTERGQSLLPTLRALDAWGREQLELDFAEAEQAARAQSGAGKPVD